MKYDKPNYVIPRGRVFLDLFDANERLTGEIPMGNCPGLTFSVSSEKKSHYSSEVGVRQKDASFFLQMDVTGKLICDNATGRNVALWLAGASQAKAQSAATVADEVVKVRPGCFYQLGATASNPVGVRNVTDIEVKNEDGTATYIAGLDYEFDLGTGRVQILETGAITAGDVKFGYKTVAGSYTSVQSGAKAELFAAIRIVSDNAHGSNTDWYAPKVMLTPNGDLSLIADSDEPVQLNFDLEALKLPNAEILYCAGRPVALG